MIFWFIIFLLGVPVRVAFGFYFYDPNLMQENLQRQGGYIPGVRPGRRTMFYLRSIYFRLALPVAIITMSLLVVPAFIYYELLEQPGIWPILLVPTMYVTGPIMDYLKLLEAKLVMRHYKGFIR